jgi:hypothetical protein
MECKENDVNDADIDDRFPADIEKVFFFTSVKNTFNTVNYKEQFLIKVASTKNVTFNVSCIKK